jgi:hypothetical protein
VRPSSHNGLADDRLLHLDRQISEKVEGDLRHWASTSSQQLDPNSLKDFFYGSGALPINYPNQLDMRRGKPAVASGCGTRDSFRVSLTDGCVALPARPRTHRTGGQIHWW